MIGMMLMNALILGVMLSKIVSEIDPDTDPVALVNGLLLFYWLFELLLRIFFQRNVTLNIQYYLVQRLSRQLLSHFMLIKSWVNLFLVLTFLLFAPFAYQSVSVLYSPSIALLWLGSLLSISFFMHHIVIAIQQVAKDNIWLPLIVGLFLIALIYLSIAGILDFSWLDQGFMQLIGQGPILLIFILIPITSLYFIDARLLRHNLYLDSIGSRRIHVVKGIGRWVSYLNSLGIPGQLIALELRLIWRNKRSRYYLIMGAIMLLFFTFIFMRADETATMQDLYMLMLSGVIMINYGQLLFSWESHYFDFIMTSNFSVKTYLTSKFILLLCFNSLSTIIISIILTFVNYRLIPELIIWYLLNSGFFIFIFIWAATLGPKRMDANASVLFNSEGANVFRFLVIIPYLLIPFGVVYLLELIMGKFWTYGSLACLGVLGIVLHKYVLNSIAECFNRRKYKILNGFRE